MWLPEFGCGQTQVTGTVGTVPSACPEIQAKSQFWPVSEWSRRIHGDPGAPLAVNCSLSPLGMVDLGQMKIGEQKD